MPPVPAGFLLYGKGPLKVRSLSPTKDIVGWTNEKDWVTPLEGTSSGYYAIKAGTQLAKDNGPEEAIKHHDPKFSDLKPLDGYRFLKVGEMTEPDDYHWTYGDGPWKISKEPYNHGFAYQTGHSPFIRKITPVIKELKKEPQMKLVLEVLNLNTTPKVNPVDGITVFRIKEQEHFPRESFDASNGIKIVSCICPAASRTTLCVRGSAKDRDYVILAVTNDVFLKFQAAIKEVLEKENAPKVIKRVTFFYQNTHGERSRRLVDVTSETGTHINGIDVDKGEPRTFLSGRIEGSITTVPN